MKGDSGIQVELFESLAALTDAMIFVTDIEANRSVWVNQALVDATGYTLEDYQFERFEHPFIPAEDAERIGVFLGEFFASDDSLSGSVRNRFIDRWGGTLHVRSRVAKITWAERPALLFVTTLEGREAERSLAVEERYRSLVEAATDAIVRLRPDLTIQYSNTAFQRMVGRKPVELNTLAFPDLVVAEEREALVAELQGEAPRIPFAAPLVGADGHAVWLEGTFVRLVRGPDAGLLQAILRDTTERRLLDARVQRAQKEQLLGQMAGGIAHDLNNILTAILGSASFVENALEPGSVLADALADVRIATQRAGELSSSMLAFAGEGNAERVPVELGALVAEMRPLLGSGLPKNVRLDIDTASDPVRVLGDETQLRQVVMNLITNAADATSAAGGIVRVQSGVRAIDAATSVAEHVFGDAPAAGEVAFVRVVDRGHGMSAAMVNRIFEPFYSTKAKGRGLGLAAVVGILGRHGGCVRVQSELGVGTEMEVWLPLTEGAIEKVRPVVRQHTRGDGTVLVVDDEEMLRRLARRTLEDVGYSVLEATTGEAALEILGERTDVSAVLLDQTMPGMGGDATLVAIRKKFPELPVVRTSGYAADPTASGPDEHTRFLGKPYAIDQLLDLVHEILHRPT